MAQKVKKSTKRFNQKHLKTEVKRRKQVQNIKKRKEAQNAKLSERLAKGELLFFAAEKIRVHRGALFSSYIYCKYSNA